MDSESLSCFHFPIISSFCFIFFSCFDVLLGALLALQKIPLSLLFSHLYFGISRVILLLYFGISKSRLSFLFSFLLFIPDAYLMWLHPRVWRTKYLDSSRSLEAAL